jgi:three-Cys-motif partner protein
MATRKEPDYDVIGLWSEIKLAILQEYAFAYSQILAAQRQPAFHHVYIDGFAGAGVHVSKATSELVPGSPLNALAVVPPFREYFLIDLDQVRIEGLRDLIGKRNDVHYYNGDCNKVLLNEVFPKVSYEDFRRGLCILDPYGLHLDWEVMRTAGEMKSLDIFINFPVLDMNRNVLWKDPDRVTSLQTERMNAFWGDETWREIAYDNNNLFGWPEKEDNEVIAEAFRQRLQRVAGFARVPEPLPMRNSKGGTVYYLFFASQKDTAEGIVLDIFEKYRSK